MEVCVDGTTGTCFMGSTASGSVNPACGATIAKTCYDTTAKMIFVRSRLQDRRGRFLDDQYIRTIKGAMMKNSHDTKAQSTIEFTFAMVAIMFLIYGMVMVFRWAGMDLANRRVAQDNAMTMDLTNVPYHDPAAQLNSDMDSVLPIAAVYHGSITNREYKSMIKKNDIKGQTALILILLTAAALIFLAITLNWGRIAQTKALVTIAADQSASLLASEAASYGEMQKQTYLKDENRYQALGGAFLSFLMLIIIVVLSIISVFCPPLAAFIAPITSVMGALAAGLMAVSFVLQLAVIAPMISQLWNKQQKNQPAPQQFYEQGIVTALQGVITDQVNITDYFDWNGNGQFGNNTSNASNDIVSRFAVFYTDRLKMLNQPDNPAVVFFYDQLAELINGETCGQSQSDNYNYGTAVAPACISAGVLPFNPSTGGCTPSTCTTSGINCVANSVDGVCQEKVPNGFQLNDPCVSNSDSSSPTYNPYCDPCCQPLSVPDPMYSAGNPLHPTPNISIRPGTTTCPDQSAMPAQCLVNNPYGGNSSSIRPTL